MDKQSFATRLTIGLLTCVARLPLGILYLVSDFAFFLLYYVVKYRRKVVVANLRRAFPEASHEQIRKYERGFYRHLCDIFVEAVKFLHISDEEVDRRIEVVDAELVNESYRNGKSIVLMLGHYGNWEWVPDIVRYFDEGLHCSQIYHPVSSKTFDAVMMQIRSRFPSENIPMERAVRRLLALHKEGRRWVCGFIADQRPTTGDKRHWTKFMGLDTAYLIGGETIGRHVGTDYLYVDVEKLKRGYYRLIFKRIVPPADDHEEYPYTREYMRMLEQSIRRAPELWLWSHKRWKHPKPKEL